MNLKEELQKMNITDLKSICKELGLPCPKSKSNIVKKLLEPLSKIYKMSQWKNKEGSYLPSNVTKNVQEYLTAPEYANLIVNKAAWKPGKLPRKDFRREILRDMKDDLGELKDNYHMILRKYNLKKLKSMGYDDSDTFKDSYKFVMWMLEKKLPLNDILKIANDQLSHYYFTKNDLLEEMERVLVISSGTSNTTGYNNVKSLLKVKDLDVNKITKKGKIALHTAIKEDNEDIVELLLKRKDLDVNKTQDKIDGNNIEGNGSTPLYMACHVANPEIIELLLKRKDLDVNKPYFGAPPLYFAVQKNDHKIVELLLKRKDLDVNKTFDGVTPLDKAVQNNYQEIVKLLLKRKDLDVNKTPDGITPLDYAVQNNYQEIIELLKEHGGIIL